MFFKNSLAITVYDEAHSFVEERWLTLGIDCLGRLIVVCHTYQELTPALSKVRIISARIATNQERYFYENESH